MSSLYVVEIADCLAARTIGHYDQAMARPKKVLTDGWDDLAEIADGRHNLNTLVTTSDWEMLKEAAFFEGTTSVSDLIRTLITSFLRDHPQREHLREVAILSMREELARQEKRNRIRPGGKAR